MIPRSGPACKWLAPQSCAACDLLTYRGARLWIIYRERSFWRALIWVALMMVLGNWTAALYVLVALYTSGGDWKRFWLGRRAGAL